MSDDNSRADDIRHAVTRQQAEDAVRTLLRWSGDDPAREGLLDTPKRVAKAYQDWFSGYALDPDDYLARTFEEVCGYDEMIVLRDIDYESHCEHHMAPIIGKVHIGYLPNGKVVGISKLAAHRRLRWRSSALRNGWRARRAAAKRTAAITSWHRSRCRGGRSVPR